MSSESTVLKVMRWFLSGVYILAGAIKCPGMESFNKDMREKFVDFATVFPGRAIGFDVDPVVYMYGVGFLELGMSVSLMFGSRSVRLASTGGLSVIMVGAVFTLASLKNYGEVGIPATFLVSLLYVMYASLQTGKTKRD